MAGEVAKPHDHLFRSVFRDEAEAAGLLRANLPQPITNALIWSTLKRRDRSFIGIQSFRTLRERNCYYVDKTAFIERLVDEGTFRWRTWSAPRTCHVYLFEFKVTEQAGEGAALAQLRERGYAAKYRDRGEPIHLIGVEFSRTTRTLTAFEAVDA